MAGYEWRLARGIAPALMLAALLAVGSGASAQEETPAQSAPETTLPAPADEDASMTNQAADSAAADPAAIDVDGTEELIATEAEAETLPAHNLSPWGMFMQADIVVKLVMIGLVFCSVLTWTVWMAKKAELGRARRRATAGMAALLEARTVDAALDNLKKQSGPILLLAASAQEEMELSGKGADKEGVKERIAWQFQRIEANAALSIGKGTGILATIGSTAPFIGLFGTVWGIMNSFIGIAESQTTNLAVVAPGIAEALLATGLGLVAAIPAVMIYNSFARAIARYRAQIADASAQVMRLVSRDLDGASRGARTSMAAE
ncbi:tonB-system energizer ExbB [Tepidicaulis sp. LMO-SS28]|uniref:tonB-system energizer ExbB n=1 Tax=Tepidicaulis sp. LMO-SS28 TaxID=3447455 RepID=UPI003EE0A1C6